MLVFEVFVMIISSFPPTSVSSLVRVDKVGFKDDMNPNDYIFTC